MPDLSPEFLAEASNRPLPSEEGISRLREMGFDLFSLEQKINKTQSELDTLKAQHWAIVSQKMPDLFHEVGVDNLGIPELNIDITLKPFYAASIPKDKAAEAHDWLEKNNAGDLIKNTVTVAFPREDAAKAGQLATFLRNRGLEPTMAKSVHHMTLTAWLKEQVTKGVPGIPFDLLGATVGQVAKIKERKKDDV